MVGAKLPLTDGEGTLVERGGLLILCMVMEVRCCLIEEMGCYMKGEGIVLDERRTGKRMRESAFTLRPGVYFYSGERLADGSDGVFCPLASRLVGHAYLDDRLDQAMDHQQLLVSVALHQRVTAQDANVFIQACFNGWVGARGGLLVVTAFF